VLVKALGRPLRHGDASCRSGPGGPGGGGGGRNSRACGSARGGQLVLLVLVALVEDGLVPGAASRRRVAAV
jgi:hypothetical protein